MKMKNLYISIMVIAMACGFTACSNSKGPATNDADSTSVGIEEVKDTSEIEDFGAASRGISSNSSYGGTFTKTKSRCSHSACHCRGYWGYKHLNGTFEGNCSNSDGNGYTCGHGPKYHGLRQY